VDDLSMRILPYSSGDGRGGSVHHTVSCAIAPFARMNRRHKLKYIVLLFIASS
jgi:hypothetical protein